MPDKTYNKVVYNGDTLIDLTGDTVVPAFLYSGYTAHNAKGEPIVGTYIQIQADWLNDDVTAEGYIWNKLCSRLITPANAADLNNFKEPGIYHRTSGIANVANSPASSPFLMEVYTADYEYGSTPTFCYQRLTESTGPTVYVRSYRYSTSEWTDWKRILTADALTTVDISTYLPSGVSAVANQGGCYYEHRNGTVHIHIAVSGLTANTNTNLTSVIPLALRPSTVVTGVGFGSALGTEAMSKAVLNNSNGTLTINATTTSARIDMYYII